MGVETEVISCCVDHESQEMFEEYTKRGLGDTALAIADAVAGNGLVGSTVLETGCGFGAHSLELVRRGAPGGGRPRLVAEDGPVGQQAGG